MKNRVISLFIIFTMLLGMMAAVQAAEETEQYKDREEILQNLMTLPEEITAEAQSISRGAYAQALAALINRGQVPAGGGSSSKFYDIYGSQRQADAVAALEARGIVSGDGSGFFEPGRNILFSEALKMLLSAMGYDEAARQSGGYPSGYIGVAAGLGLLNNIALKAEDMLTGTAFMQLFYNALETDILVADKILGDFFVMKSGEKKVLNGFLQCGMQKGVLDATAYTALYSAAGLGGDRISVDGTVYMLSEQARDIIEYLGYRVKIYFREIDGADTIVAYELLNNDVLEIEDENLISFEDFVLYYEKDGREKHISLDKGMSVIYNGVYTDHYTAQMLTPALGSVRLIKNGNSSKYDVIIIEDYQNDVVAAVDVPNNRIYKRINTQDILELGSSAGNVFIVSDQGYDMELTDIPVNAVISVMSSRDGSYIKMIVSTQTIVGTVGAIHSNSTERTVIEVAGERILTAKEFDMNAVSGGSSCEFYLDFKGRAVFCIDTAFSEGWCWGYLIHYYQDEAQEDYLKVLRSDNLTVDYKIKSRININGERYELDNLKGCISLFSEGKLKRQVVRFQINSSGELTKIQTADAEHSEKSPLRLLASGRKMYRGTSKTFEFISYLKDDTIVFVVPALNTPYKQDGSFRVENVGYFTDYGYYQINAYAVGDGMSEASAVAVVQNDDELAAEISENNSLYVVANKEMCMNEDDEVVTSLTLRLGNQEVTYPVIEEAWENVKCGTQTGRFEVEKGDTIRFSLNKKNEINLLQLIYDASVQSYTKPNSAIINTSFNGQPAMIYARAESRPEDSINRVTVNMGFLTGDRNLRMLPAEQFTSTVIHYNERSVTVEPYTNASQIKTADTFGEENASKIYA